MLFRSPSKASSDVKTETSRSSSVKSTQTFHEAEARNRLGGAECSSNMVSNNISIINKAKGTLPRVPLSIPFALIKSAMLGDEYDLSLVFVGDKEAQALNIEHRGKDYIPNVLSFELDESAGEVFINPKEAKRQAPDFDRTPTNMIAFLFIHALCHLKGMEHGATMERTEAKFREEFGI